MTKPQSNKPRLLFLNGVWLLKMPNGTMRDVTREELKEMLNEWRKKGRDA